MPFLEVPSAYQTRCPSTKKASARLHLRSFISLSRRFLGPDRAFALLLAAVALSLFAFVSLAGEVVEGDTRAFDTRLLLALRTPGDLADPIGPAWLEEMVRDFTALGSTGVLTIVTLGATGFLLIRGRRRMAIFVLTAVIGGVLLSNLLKIGFNRPRPDLVPHGVEVFTNSFPSGHAMMSAVVYLTLGNLLASAETTMTMRLFIMSFATMLAVLVGVSRIYLGVHWPSDVLAGWAVGACWALACLAAMTRLKDAGRMN